MKDTLSILSAAFRAELPDEIREQLMKHAFARGLNAEELVESYRVAYIVGTCKGAVRVLTECNSGMRTNSNPLCGLSRSRRQQGNDATLKDTILWAVLSAELPLIIRDFVVKRALALDVNVDELLESYRQIYKIGLYDGATEALGRDGGRL